MEQGLFVVTERSSSPSCLSCEKTDFQCFLFRPLVGIVLLHGWTAGGLRSVAWTTRRLRVVAGCLDAGQPGEGWVSSLLFTTYENGGKLTLTCLHRYTGTEVRRRPQSQLEILFI